MLVPVAQVGEAKIAYEERGSGFPILLIAPGGMRSAAALWERAPWNPIDHLAEHFRVVAMDQRNAGRSVGPIRPGDGWETFRSDQLGLLDALGIDRFHYLGMCIGGSYGFGLIEAAPERVVSAVLLQPIGLDQNREAFFEIYDAWASDLRAARPEVSDEALASLREAMFGGDFLFNTSPRAVEQCRTPLLVLMGKDLHHPESISRSVASLAPKARLIERWKEPAHRDAARAAVLEFLLSHTPTRANGRSG